MKLPAPFRRWLANPPRVATRRSQQSGFVYLMALFMVLLMIASSTVVMENMRTQRKRQKEEMMIWRGEQYERAIRTYFRKTGHYPQNLDELEKGLPNLHFLRYSAYRNPMNANDGTWRFIYVNAAGQLIGSVKYASLQQMALADLNLGTQGTQSNVPGTPVSQIAAAQSGQTGNGMQPPAGQLGAATSSPAQSGVFTAGGIGGTGAGVLAQKPTGPVSGPVIGGFLTGVAGTEDETQNSIRVYHGGTTYKDWEFIWNPIEEQARGSAQVLSNLRQGGGLNLGVLPLGALGQPSGTGAPALPPDQAGAPSAPNSPVQPAAPGNPAPPAGPQQQ